MTAAFHVPSARVAFLLIPLSRCQEPDLDDLMLGVIFGDKADSYSDSIIILLGIDAIELKEGSWVGIGADLTGIIHFAIDGDYIGSSKALCRVEKYLGSSFMPYFRNCPRYILNFGQYDFKFKFGNLNWSPSRIEF